MEKQKETIEKMEKVVEAAKEVSKNRSSLNELEDGIDKLRLLLKDLGDEA